VVQTLGMPVGVGSRIKQQTVKLNDFGVTERLRTTSRGTSSRFTVSITAAPITLVFDPKAMGQPVAEAIAEVIRTKVRDIGETVSPATIAARQRARDAFSRGEPWARRRYGAAPIPQAASVIALGPAAPDKRSNSKRLGGMEPGQTSRFWNDSGRFAAGLIVRPTKGNEWVVNVPANRFDPVTFRGGRAALLDAIARLQQLVPELGNARELLKHPDVRAAMGEATSQLLGTLPGKAFNNNRRLQRLAKNAQFGALKDALRASRAVTTILGL